MSLLSFVCAFVVGSALIFSGVSAHAAPGDLPTEIDSIVVRRTAVLTAIRGEILRKLEDGSLAPVAEGASVRPGEILLVRRGASFKIGKDTIGAETHGDRWVRFE